MPCNQKEKNDKRCNCTYAGCPRHGVCCDCIAYHNANGEFPGCFFSKEGERTWDRSLAMLIKDRQKNR